MWGGGGGEGGAEKDKPMPFQVLVVCANSWSATCPWTVPPMIDDHAAVHCCRFSPFTFLINHSAKRNFDIYNYVALVE